MAIYTCTVCRTQGEWSAAWSWFGAYIDIDNGRNVPKFCGDVCRDQWAADNAQYVSQVSTNKPTASRRGAR